MSMTTDPAKQLAEICTALSGNSDKPGDEHLANHFGVSAWSADFYRIIFCIVQRIDEVQSIIIDLDIDDDIKTEAKGHLGQIRAAFSKQCLNAKWGQGNSGTHYLNKQNITPIKMLSPTIRTRYEIVELSKEEISEITEEAQTLKDWLEEHQLAEQDFIRQALIDGLENFLFSLKYLKWVGFGYVLDSLREVIGAYLALEKGFNPDTDQPNTEAILKKANQLCKTVYDKIDMAKNFGDNVDFLLRLYGASSLFLSAPKIGGLLT